MTTLKRFSLSTKTEFFFMCHAYFIHWTIFTGGYLAIIIGLGLFFTTDTLYESAQYISKFGTTLVTAGSAIFYFFIYYVGVVLGTARFARSSVLFANKLPGNL